MSTVDRETEALLRIIKESEEAKADATAKLRAIRWKLRNHLEEIEKELDRFIGNEPR